MAAIVISSLCPQSACGQAPGPAARTAAQHIPGIAPGTGDKAKIDKALGKQPYSPYADRNYPARPLWGDTHLHTGLSMDAGVFGARLRPRDAYRFARGEQVTASGGQPAKLGRPLDFLVVTDPTVHIVLDEGSWKISGMEVREEERVI